MAELEKRISKLRQRIAEKASELGISADSITVVAVTKTQSAETVNAALRAGITHFGENKVQEAEDKLPQLTAPYEGFHFIGHLQTNKIKALLALNPCLIHSVDSIHVARQLNSYMEGTDRVQDILLQVNTSGETSKFGIRPLDLPALAREATELKHLKVRGLMTIGRLSDDPEAARQDFRLLKQLSDTLQKLEIPNLELTWLSMGMTHDYEIALEEGANIIRIGSAIFGERHYDHATDIIPG